MHFIIILIIQCLTCCWPVYLRSSPTAALRLRGTRVLTAAPGRTCSHTTPRCRSSGRPPTRWCGGQRTAARNTDLGNSYKHKQVFKVISNYILIENIGSRFLGAKCIDDFTILWLIYHKYLAHFYTFDTEMYVKQPGLCYRRYV